MPVAYCRVKNEDDCCGHSRDRAVPAPSQAEQNCCAYARQYELESDDGIQGQSHAAEQRDERDVPDVGRLLLHQRMAVEEALRAIDISSGVCTHVSAEPRMQEDIDSDRNNGDREEPQGITFPGTLVIVGHTRSSRWVRTRVRSA